MNSHNHIYHNDPFIYQSIIDQISKISNRDNYKILDVGCGDGAFLKGLINFGMKGIFFGTDLSYNMLKFAHDNIPHPDVRLFVADGFKLPLKEDTKFDLIHIDSVLHHLIGKNRLESKNMIRRMIQILVNKLNKNGIIVIEEKYYHSYIFPTITATIIFYGLKLFNSAKLDASKIIKEYSRGLEVNFLHEEELINIIKKHGKPQLLKRRKVRVATPYKFLFLKDHGHISFMLQNN